MTERTPEHLLAELGKYHANTETWILVAQLELFGHEVSVRRLQLGKLNASGFGDMKEIYRTPERKSDDARSS